MVRAAPQRHKATPTGLVWLKPTPSGPIPVALTNFRAEIVADVAEDDGTGGWLTSESCETPCIRGCSKNVLLVTSAKTPV